MSQKVTEKQERPEDLGRSGVGAATWQGSRWKWPGASSLEGFLRILPPVLVCVCAHTYSFSLIHTAAHTQVVAMGEVVHLSVSPLSCHSRALSSVAPDPVFSLLLGLHSISSSF